jgi:iron complex outermembrane receptor protein
MYGKPLVFSSVLGLLVLVSPALLASGLLEEVIVTAQKRQESIQNVGISITAFSADQMRELGFTDSTRIAAMSPGVQINYPNGLSSFSFSVRGVTQSDFSDHQEAPVSVYIDEVYISQMPSAGFQLFDMERVETLRGPQGTLFGRNATGGLIHFVTQKPFDKFSAYSEITYGDYDQLGFEGAVGGPLSDIISARASIKTNQHDGYIDNGSGPDGNEQKNYAGRLQTLLKLGERGDFLLSIRGAKNDVDTPQYWKNAAATVGPTGVGVFINGDVSGEVHAGNWNMAGGWDIETYSTSGTLNWNFDNLTLTSITDYSDLDKTYLADADEGANSTLLHFGADNNVRQFSQEVRISSTAESALRWVAGFYFLDIEGDYKSSFVAPGTIAFLGFAPLNGVYNTFSTDTQSRALFGQLEYDITPAWTITAGLRWTEDDKNFDYLNNLALTADVLNPLPVPPAVLVPIGAFNETMNGDQAKIDAGMWSAKAALNWQSTDDLLYYVSWNRGIKAGSFNAPVFSLPANEMKFDEEVLNAYEIGMKVSLLNNRLRINAATFYYDYDDIQAYQLEGFTQVIRNKDGDSKGAEIEIAATPADNLDMLFGVSYLDATIKDVAAGFVTIDAHPQMAPMWNLSGLLRYQWSAFGGTMALQGDFNYLSKHYFDIANSDVIKQDGYMVGNARLSYRTQDEKWEASAFVRNIDNESYATWAYDIAALTGVIEKSYGMPRWWGISLRYSIN